MAATRFLMLFWTLPLFAAEALDGAREAALRLQRQGTHWNLPSYLGRQWVSHYYLMQRLLGVTDPSTDPARLASLLRATQLRDGSWRPLPDSRDKTGDLNATLLNYWALRAMGTSVDDPNLARARAYLVQNGGLERANLFNKILLALAGNYPWSRLPHVPTVLFSPYSPFTAKSFAQWIGPHILPIAYLKAHAVVRAVPELRLAELGASRDPVRPMARGRTAHKLVGHMLAAQQSRGSWGGYTIATLLTLTCLDDFQVYRGPDPRRDRARERGWAFLKWLSTEDDGMNGLLDDGHYWDSWLIALGLAEAGMPAERLRPTADYLAARACPNGGFSFGVDFCHAPDADDTAMGILLLAKLGGYDVAVARAKAWLLSQQNRDGGWGAFARNNHGNLVLDRFLKPFEDSADLFDESSPDITGHVLEALAATGETARSKPIRRAVAYLRRAQKADGAWEGRWAINYVYGTSAALVGLVRAGVRDPFVGRGARWLASRQNADGGFGETALSYDEPRYAGLGQSTPTQTAWALLALVDTGLRARADRAAAYLERTAVDGTWRDEWAVGTGHPSLIYMVYPSYPRAFPLMALGRYLRAARSSAAR